LLIRNTFEALESIHSFRVKISFIYWNVKGITLPSNKMLVNDLVVMQTRLLCLYKEVKMVGFDLHMRMSFCLQGLFWSTNHEQGSGGLVLGVAPSLDGRALWSSVQGPKS